MSKLSAHQKGVLAIILANIIWGAAPPIFKLALQDIPPFTLAFVRFFSAMLILFPFVIRKPWIERKDWPLLILTTFFGITVNISFLFIGLQRSDAIDASMIATSGPIFLYLLSIFVLKEKMHPKILSGTIVSLSGVILIIALPIFTSGQFGEIIGNFFFLMSTLGAVGHTIVAKYILRKYEPTVITFWTFFIAAITFLPLFARDLIYTNPFMTMDYRGWTGIVFGIFLSSLAAYSLFDWGISKIYAQEVGIFSYVDPIVTSLIAVPLLNETITPLFIAASCLVFSGIIIAEGRLPYHPFHLLRHR